MKITPERPPENHLKKPQKTTMKNQLKGTQNPSKNLDEIIDEVRQLNSEFDAWEKWKKSRSEELRKCHCGCNDCPESKYYSEDFKRHKEIAIKLDKIYEQFISSAKQGHL